MVSVSNKRKERDLMKLMMSNYEVTLTDEGNQNDFYVLFKGPSDSAYEGVILFYFTLLFSLIFRAFGKFM
jgi:hypothetical protein